MQTRRVVLGCLGLLAAGFVGLVGAQILAVGLGWSPPVAPDAVGTATQQLSESRQPGAAMLVGLGFALLALGLAVVWFTDLIVPRRPMITVRRDGGKTKIDRPSLEAALERELNRVDVRTNVDVSVRRRGRTLVMVHTADPSRTGPPGEVAQRLQELIDGRHLPISVKRLTVGPATGKAKRRRVA